MGLLRICPVSDESVVLSKSHGWHMWLHHSFGLVVARDICLREHAVLGSLAVGDTHGGRPLYHQRNLR